MRPEQRYCRGLFAGGTFCYQAQQIFLDTGLSVQANSPLEGGREVPDPWRSFGHSLVDMGRSSYTRGRPHPMRTPRSAASACSRRRKIPKLPYCCSISSWVTTRRPNPVGT